MIAMKLEIKKSEVLTENKTTGLAGMERMEMTKKTEMKTETVYFGDCLKHLKQWIQWNKSLLAMTASFISRFDLSRPAVEQQGQLQHPLWPRESRCGRLPHRPRNRLCGYVAMEQGSQATSKSNLRHILP